VGPSLGRLNRGLVGRLPHARGGEPRPGKEKKPFLEPWKGVRKTERKVSAIVLVEKRSTRRTPCSRSSS